MQWDYYCLASDGMQNFRTQNNLHCCTAWKSSDISKRGADFSCRWSIRIGPAFA